MFKKKLFTFSLLFSFIFSYAQQEWKNVDSLYQPLPKGMHVYVSNSSLDGKPNKAFYVSAELKEKSLTFTAEVGNGKRFTPAQYYEQGQQPVVVMNTTFFEFKNNSNLNVVIKDGQLEAYQIHTMAGKGKDTLTYRHPLGSAIGITSKRKADIAWVYSDTTAEFAFASQKIIPAFKDSISHPSIQTFKQKGKFKKWKMQTAVGGGPVLVQNGAIQITNNEELKFAGKAINDKHPRTAIGYTADGRLILMAIEGRFPGKAEGATLGQVAEMLKELGCEEAMNLDGGGSSCLLVNGKQTITPSDKEGQRPVPAVFLIKQLLQVPN